MSAPEFWQSRHSVVLSAMEDLDKLEYVAPGVGTLLTESANLAAMLCASPTGSASGC